MINICVVTTCRSEYGLLRWVMEEIRNSKKLRLQVLVTGSHLATEFGLTYHDIENDGFQIDEKVAMLITSNEENAIAKSMGICAMGVSDVFSRIHPDAIVVLGDRYELLSICSVALVMRIPIIHIAGGDLTEGAIDNDIRNAVTKMASLHFPGTDIAAKRIQNLGEENWRIQSVGETNIDAILRVKKLTRSELAIKYSLNPELRWCLVTYHPETKVSLEVDIQRLENLLKALVLRDGFQIICTYPNSDYGCFKIIDKLKEFSEKYENIVIIKNLGQQDYISVLSQSDFMAGNSSSCIFESPILGIPAINIGGRQSGRYMAPNIKCSDGSLLNISHILSEIMDPKFKLACGHAESPYGDGTASERIVRRIEEVFSSKTLQEILNKR